MHQYLKALGFQYMESRKNEKSIIQKVLDEYDIRTSHSDSGILEYRKNFGDNFGISLYGYEDEDGVFEMEYYCPYTRGSGISSYAEIVIEKRKDKEAYIGVCEDIRVGVHLIFYLQNLIDYKLAEKKGLLGQKETSVNLSGLALSGKILLPIKKTTEVKRYMEEEKNNRLMLVNAAREGDMLAMDTLTLEDMETYSSISKRIEKEDVFTIVETYFMPYGVECDEYSVMGEITKYHEVCNNETKEVLYQMIIYVNGVEIEVYVPKANVLGEPDVGRRFKGTVWLQGYINF